MDLRIYYKVPREIQIRTIRKVLLALRREFTWEMNRADEENDQTLVIILKHWIKETDEHLERLPKETF